MHARSRPPGSYASGGLASIDNVKALMPFESEGIAGAIAGRAIYEGTLDFKEAIKAARGNAPG